MKLCNAALVLFFANLNIEVRPPDSDDQFIYLNPRVKVQFKSWVGVDVSSRYRLRWPLNSSIGAYFLSGTLSMWSICYSEELGKIIFSDTTGSDGWYDISSVASVDQLVGYFRLVEKKYKRRKRNRP